MGKLEIIKELHGLLDATARRQPEIDKIVEGRSIHLSHVPTIKCADGFGMSVQASEFHYCSPRDSKGPWSAVEVGFPTAKVEAFMPYIDGADSNPTDTVYGYVPLGIVAETILEHGGFASKNATPVSATA